MLPMICLNEPHPQVQQSNAVTMETVLHPQYTGLVSTAILDGAISLYQSLEGFLWPTEHRYCRAKTNLWRLQGIYDVNIIFERSNKNTISFSK